MGRVLLFEHLLLDRGCQERKKGHGLLAVALRIGAPGIIFQTGTYPVLVLLVSGLTLGGFIAFSTMIDLAFAISVSPKWPFRSDRSGGLRFFPFNRSWKIVHVYSSSNLSAK